MRLINATGLAALLLPAMSVQGCTSQTDGSGPPQVTASVGSATVTVSMYSGRRDPQFRLTSQQVDALRSCLAGSGPIGAASPSNGLGFRYFEVEGIGEQKALVAKNGVWRSDGEPIPACPAAFSTLRTAAAAALPKEMVDNIPEV